MLPNQQRVCCDAVCLCDSLWLAVSYLLAGAWIDSRDGGVAAAGAAEDDDAVWLQELTG